MSSDQSSCNYNILEDTSIRGTSVTSRPQLPTYSRQLWCKYFKTSKDSTESKLARVEREHTQKSSSGVPGARRQSRTLKVEESQHSRMSLFRVLFTFTAKPHSKQFRSKPSSALSQLPTYSCQLWCKYFKTCHTTLTRHAYYTSNCRATSALTQNVKNISDVM